jgi:hypothetical protein
MPAYSENDFCKADQGLKYLFAKMRIIYGNRFDSHWEGIDKKSINQTWIDLLGVYATYRPCMDFALAHMDSKFIPSALEFRDLCSQAGRIPHKPHSMIEKQKTQEEIISSAILVKKELEKIRIFYRKITN